MLILGADASSVLGWARPQAHRMLILGADTSAVPASLARGPAPC
jgi:hypothetical protein